MLEFLKHIQTEYTDLYNWVLFPFIIFCSRLCDVSLGTLRSVLSAKGHKKIVPFIGFFEVLLWLVAVSQILKNLNNVMSYVAWGGGYAVGIYVGLAIEEKLALGKQVMRIITDSTPDELLTIFQKKNIGYTALDGHGARGPVKLIFTVVERKEVRLIAGLVKQYAPHSFYSVEDVKYASDVHFGIDRKPSYFRFLFPLRK